MLDDLKMIHTRDPQDALGIAEKEGKQLVEAIALHGGQGSFIGIQNVVYAGMGGSALAALLARTWPPLGVPFEIVRNYDIPEYVNEHTLFIAASYSGNTEETLSALAQAEARKAMIAIIAGGGQLQQIAEEKGYLFAKLPTIGQPRYAVFSNYRALLELLAQAGLLTEDFRPPLEAAAALIEESVQSWRPDVPTKQNYAKQLALECIGKSIVVYAGPNMYPAAYKWKIDFNENAKQVAWVNQYPEFNHNEFIGWSKQPIDKPYAVIDIRSQFEHSRVQKRFVLTERLLSGLRPSPIVVEPHGNTPLEQMLWAVVLGDFVTIYVALLNGLNPTPVDLVEKFKLELNKA